MLVMASRPKRSLLYLYRGEGATFDSAGRRLPSSDEKNPGRAGTALAIMAIPMNPKRIAAVALLAFCAAVLFPGCVHWFARHSKAGATKTGLYAIKPETSSFYRFGPQQGHGPDRELARDTVVTVIRRSFGYTKVRLEDGESGFVANDDLVPAPQRLIAQVEDTSTESAEPLPPTPQVALPVSDSSPEFEPTPLPQPLMPQ
jgi:hypothetical protein